MESPAPEVQFLGTFAQPLTKNSSVSLSLCQWLCYIAMESPAPEVQFLGTFAQPLTKNSSVKVMHYVNGYAI